MHGTESVIPIGMALKGGIGVKRYLEQDSVNPELECFTMREGANESRARTRVERER
jgi:hypothetical protein